MSLSFETSPVIAVLFLVGRSINVTSEGNICSNTTLVHSLTVMLKHPRTANPVALPAVQAFSTLLPLKMVVAPEMSTRKALGITFDRTLLHFEYYATVMHTM